MQKQPMLRLAVPYDERILGLPNQGFRTLIEALWETTHPFFDIWKCHANDLLADTAYDAVFLVRTVGGSETHLKHYSSHNIFIAIWHDDLHRHLWTKDEINQLWLKRCDQANIIFLPYFRQMFDFKIYRPFIPKMLSSPWSVPDKIFHFARPWESRIPKILFSGMVARQYPLRKRIRNYILRTGVSDFDIQEHPSYNVGNLSHDIIGQRYYERLGQYQGAIVTSAQRPVNYTVAKYFEVPGCGTLSFMEKTPDLLDFGFVEDENYIPITRWNYKRQIKIIHSQEGIRIADRGCQLVMKRHTHSVRIANILSHIYSYIKARSI